MTDKKIIVDGCDVSGCAYYADDKCTNSHMVQSNCKNVAVCYYKEYKRKEQECERLMSTLTEIKEIVLLTLDCGEWIGQGDNKMEVILQKISEVLE